MKEPVIGTPRISAQRVTEIFKECHLKPEEYDPVEGPKIHTYHALTSVIGQKLFFHPRVVETHKEEIRGMLKELPLEFHKEGGGGWSFLNMCVDRLGYQWGDQTSALMLVALGTAAHMVTYPVPSGLWKDLPGGMPYIRIDTSYPN